MRKKVNTVKSVLVDCLLFILTKMWKHVFNTKVNLGAYKPGFFRSVNGRTLVKLKCMTTGMDRLSHSGSVTFFGFILGNPKGKKYSNVVFRVLMRVYLYTWTCTQDSCKC